MRKGLAIVLNLLIPGGGLIVLRREWLGATVAMLFGILTHTAIWGLWLVPATIPRFVSQSAAIGAAIVWVGAQGLLWGRWRLVYGAGLALELESLLRRADEALENGDSSAAHELLVVARALDDEHVGVTVRWARLMSHQGRFHLARKAWRRVLRLRPGPEENRQALEALSAMPNK